MKLYSSIPIMCIEKNNDIVQYLLVMTSLWQVFNVEITF